MGQEHGPQRREDERLEDKPHLVQQQAQQSEEND
jgi:hypothetical protein